jgi:hypothetical protein
LAQFASIITQTAASRHLQEMFQRIPMVPGSVAANRVPWDNDHRTMPNGPLAHSDKLSRRIKNMGTKVALAREVSAFENSISL